MIVLLFLLWPAPAPAAPTAQARAALECEDKTRDFDHAREEINYQTQSCRKDRDCVLLFQGAKLSTGCDLGVAAARKVMGTAYFSRLKKLRSEAESVCPAPDPSRPHCRGVPAKRAVCRDQVCDTK